MSYARFSAHSDVYVYADARGFITCCRCKLEPVTLFKTADEVVAHLELHVDAGHRVPTYLMNRDVYPDEDFVEDYVYD